MVVVAVVVVVAIVVYMTASGTFHPAPASGGSPTSTVSSQNLVNTDGQTFGPGTSGANVILFTVPASASAVWVNGSFAVTKCTSIGDYCLGWAMVLTPSAWANAQSGAAYTAVFCYTAGTTTCAAAQNVDIASGNLVDEGYAGQSLDLVLWSGASTLSQQYSADATLTSITVG